MSQRKKEPKSTLAKWRSAMSERPFDNDTHAASEIRLIRAKLHWTQQELANHLGTYQATVARWEAGTHVPRGGYLKALEKLWKQVLRVLEEQESGWRPNRRKK
jgi:DNA-binding transcriptional regulator YiaG